MNRWKRGERRAVFAPHYLIDTNIWSHLQRRTTQALVAKFANLKPVQTYLSPVILGEMETGFLKGDRAPHRRIALDQIMVHVKC